MTASLFGINGAMNVSGTIVPEVFTATASQSVFVLTEFTYTLTTNSLVVWKNGLKLLVNVDYTEISTTSFTLATPASLGDKIEAWGIPATTANADASALQSRLSSILAGNGASMVAFQGGNTVQDLTSTASGKGASLVGIEDAGGYYAGATVEAALQNAGPALTGIFGPNKLQQGNASNTLIRNVTTTTPTRIHIEPNGYVTGTAAKLDWMLDPYQQDGVNYRIRNIYTKTYDAADASTTGGDNGIVVDGVKGTGDHFGIYPAWHFGYSDDSATAVPMKLHYFDHTDTAWRTPLRGAWRAGITVNAGDYILASFQLYQTTTGGTTGSTKPNHTSGSASDGGVTWDWVRNFQTASSHIKAIVLFGDRDTRPLFGFENIRVQFGADSLVFNGKKIRYVGSGGLSNWSLYSPGGSTDFYIENEAGTGRMRFGSSFIQINGLSLISTGNSDNSNATTTSITGVRVLTYGNTAPTTITQFTNGVSNQEFYVRSSNGQTTIAHNANIRLVGGVNLTLNTDTVLLFLMNTAGTIATQVRGT